MPIDKWELRKDLSELNFETATGGQEPYVAIKPVDKESLPPGYFWKDNPPRELVNVGAYYGEIWATLQQMTNFIYTMVKY